MAVVLLGLWSAAAFAQGGISSEYCAAGNFSDQCTGLDPASAECTARQQLARQQCDAQMNSVSSKIFGFIKQNLADILAIVFAVSTIVVTGMARFFKNQAAKLKIRLADPYIEHAPRYETTGLSIMLVGIGGSGKTSLVRALSASDHAKPDVATAHSRTYSLANEVTVNQEAQSSRRLVRFYITDHVGQDFKTILESDFYRDAKISKLKKCLVLVVDLFTPTGETDAERAHQDFDGDRIKDNLEAYPDEMIQLLTSSLRPDDEIVLFINKIDQLRTLERQMLKKATDQYKPLTAKLKGIKGTKFSLLVGSAANGLNVCGTEANGSKGGLLGILVHGAEPIKTL